MFHRHAGKKFNIRCTAEFKLVRANWTCMACNLKGTTAPVEFLDDAISAAIAEVERHECPPEPPAGEQHRSSGVWWVIALVAICLLAWLLMLGLLFWWGLAEGGAGRWS